MRAEFVGETIEVALDENKPGKPPVAVTWRGQEWPGRARRGGLGGHVLGTMRPGAGRWWQRRHRTYFQVTVRGEAASSNSTTIGEPTRGHSIASCTSSRPRPERLRRRVRGGQESWRR